MHLMLVMHLGETESSPKMKIQSLSTQLDVDGKTDEVLYPAGKTSIDQHQNTTYAGL